MFSVSVRSSCFSPLSSQVSWFSQHYSWVCVFFIVYFTKCFQLNLMLGFLHVLFLVSFACCVSETLETFLHLVPFGSIFCLKTMFCFLIERVSCIGFQILSFFAFKIHSWERGSVFFMQVFLKELRERRTVRTPNTVDLLQPRNDHCWDERNQNIF